jgi:hypothetical protein
VRLLPGGEGSPAAFSQFPLAVRRFLKPFDLKEEDACPREKGDRKKKVFSCGPPGNGSGMFMK